MEMKTEFRKMFASLASTVAAQGLAM
jgi:hypothetical protein